MSAATLGVLAGLLSGIYILVLYGLRWVGALRSSLEGSQARLSCQQLTIATSGPRSAKLAAADWLLQDLRLELDSSGDGGSAGGVRAPPGGRSPNDAQGQADVARVRELMERLVEALVSGGLDDVALRPLHPHPAYDSVYRKHQPRLRSALTSLAYSLQMALAHKPLSESETPGRAHAQLRSLVLDLARDVADLPPLTTQGFRRGLSADGILLEDHNDFGSKAYEDLLATAIVNKVMERSAQRSRSNGESAKPDPPSRRRHNFISSLEVRLGSADDSSASSPDRSLASWTSSRDSRESRDSDPLSLMIEECIEEVTTVTASSAESTDVSSSDTDDLGSLVGVRRRRRRSRRRGDGREGRDAADVLPGLSFLRGRTQRVPFPELGVDIVDASGSDSDVDGDNREDAPPSCVELVTPLHSWEDNWLFQSRRLKTPHKHGHQPVPVPMLVPNPSEDFRALIGDVDAEETSDLSECSDDALEEVVLSGTWDRKKHNGSMRVNGTGPVNGDVNGDVNDDVISDDLLDDTETRGPVGADRAHLAGLAETCNLELLRRATAPGDGDGCPSLSSLPTMDKDSEVTVVYDYPTRMPARPPQGDLTPPASPVPPAQVSTRGMTHPKQSTKPKEPSQPTQPTLRQQVPVEPTPPASPITGKTSEDREEQDSGQASLESQDHGHGHVQEDVLATPPRPGTIADREHRKWEQATPLPNNPYSPENIQRRLQGQQRTTARAQELVDLPEKVSNTEASPAPAIPQAVETTPPTAPLHIALGVEPDPRRYGRDFYINGPRTPDSGATVQRRSGPTETRDAKEQKELTQFSSAPSNGIDVSDVGSKQTDVRTNGDGGPSSNMPECEGGQEPDLHDLQELQELQALPSVKQLAKQFLQQEPAAKAPELQKTKAPKKQRVVIVDKDQAEQTKSSRNVRQVHSLTARSMSREFREGLRRLSPPGPHKPGALRPDPEGAQEVEAKCENPC